jgi:RNA polymerase sigma-70 factor, ECF subfamily
MKELQRLDDAEMVAAARRGDAAAFEELVRLTSKALYARIYLDTANPHLAEDLTQETYLKAWRDIRQLAPAGNFRAWLYTIAHTVVVDAARRRLRKKRDSARETPASVDFLADASSSPPDHAEQHEERQKLLAVLRNLPAEYRQVVAMRYLLGEDYETIGRQLGITNGSLRGLLNRGLNMLRDHYAKLEQRRAP